MMLNSNEQKVQGVLHWQGTGLKQSRIKLGLSKNLQGMVQKIWQALRTTGWWLEFKSEALM